jgi:fructuronate reductase
VAHVHLGLGNFFRAHQAFYTELAGDGDEWGIAAFTGRSPALADAMARQQGLYTLVTQEPAGDRYDVISSVSCAHPGTDMESWLAYLQTPQSRIVTLTVTEAAYMRDEDGKLDSTRPEVQADIEALRYDDPLSVVTVPGRIAAGLAGRRAADAGPIAVVPCDNLSANGSQVARVVTDLAAEVDPALAQWITESVSFVTSMVDRITPRASEEDRLGVERHTGVRDRCPVVTEPFTEWVLQGEFPAGRPRWEDGGAAFVDDVTAFEQRKLWLLNGAHSLLAYAGSIRGHVTVAEAVNDPACVAWMEQWWDEASRHLAIPTEAIAGYRAALVDRFSNPGMRHLLAQIAADGTQKLPMRTVPVLLLERAQGRLPLGATRTLAAWVLHLRGLGAPVTDAHAAEAVALAHGPLADAVRRTLSYLSPELGEDTGVVSTVVAQMEELSRT